MLSRLPLLALTAILAAPDLRAAGPVASVTASPASVEIRHHRHPHEVQPVLARAGCNAGACHGYSLGKNGFKLSLRGESPEADYPAIVREFAGRRVNFTQPAASLLVAKARGDVPHEGG